MHRFVKLAACAVAGLTLCVSVVEPVAAQSLRKVKTPAENPPASFKGKQYVDSRGCVFIRAGFGGKVTWVPRVNRQRKVFCSGKNTPSLSKSQLASLSGSAPVIQDPQPTQVASAPVKKVVRRVPKTKVVKIPPKKVVRKAPVKVVKRPVRVVQQQPTIVVQQPVRTQQTATYKRGQPQAVHPGDLVRGSAREVALAPRVVRVPAQQVVVQQPVRRVVVAAPTPQPTQQRVYRPSNGSQQVHPGDLVRNRRLTAAAAANGSVYQTQPQRRVVTQTGVRVPLSQTVDPIHGLPITGPIIDPDVTYEGDAQMALVWTNTVPRRLVKQKVRVRKVARKTQAVRTVRSTKSYAQPKQPAARGKLKLS